jgi:hypothetical protein
VEKETRERLNPEILVVSQGYNVKWIPNPDYPRKSEEEFIQVAQWDNEFVEIWYFLTYQGKDSEGFREPFKKVKKYKDYIEGRRYYYYWEPEKDSWRGSTKEEIIEFYNDQYAIRLRTEHTKIKIFKGFKAKLSSEEIEIPISQTYKLSSGKIIKRWRSFEDPDELYNEV